MGKRKAAGAERCPKCGGAKVATILWGLPVFSRRLERELRAGRTTLGGCCVTGQDPDRRCNACGHQWRG